MSQPQNNQQQGDARPPVNGRIQGKIDAAQNLHLKAASTHKPLGDAQRFDYNTISGDDRKWGRPETNRSTSSNMCRTLHRPEQALRKHAEEPHSNEKRALLYSKAQQTQDPKYRAKAIEEWGGTYGSTLSLPYMGPAQKKIYLEDTFPNVYPQASRAERLRKGETYFPNGSKSVTEELKNLPAPGEEMPLEDLFDFGKYEADKEDGEEDDEDMGDANGEEEKEKQDIGGVGGAPMEDRADSQHSQQY